LISPLNLKTYLIFKNFVFAVFYIKEIVINFGLKIRSYFYKNGCATKDEGVKIII